jgi:dephospho-CoA kinase
MKKILGLVGETGSGKDIFCDYLRGNFKNVFVFRFSQPLTEALRIFFDEVKKEDQQWLATCLRKRFGNNILGEVIKNRIKNIKKGIIVLNGIRAWEEYRMIKNLGGKIIYITASPQKRWQRIQKRKEKKDDKISYQKFLKLEKVKTEILIPRIGQKADFKIENNGSKNNFYKECKKILTQVNL